MFTERGRLFAYPINKFLVRQYPSRLKMFSPGELGGIISPKKPNAYSQP